MNRKLARRLPLVRKWVRKLDALEEKYARLKSQRDSLKRQRDHLKNELAEIRAPLDVIQRQEDERRALRHKQESKLPIPPASLRLRVHGTDDEVAFLAVGETIASRIREIVSAEDRSLDGAERIVDFGCGCGRVLRFFENPPLSGQLFATDIDQEAIAWCKTNLASLASFSRNGDQPPLEFERDSFDLILAISVFTHLPEALELSWLRELQRIAQAGAILLLTVHGERLFNTVPSASYDELSRRGFCYAACGATAGLPDYYQTSFHSRAYVELHWSELFHIRRIVALGGQDVVVCEKRPTL
jgi:SAM-dependent methyltransferase